MRSCDVLQQALFAQQPIWHAFGLDVFDKMHCDAGNRPVAVKSARPTATDTVILLIIAYVVAQSAPTVECYELAPWLQPRLECLIEWGAKIHRSILALKRVLPVKFVLTSSVFASGDTTYKL